MPTKRDFIAIAAIVSTIGDYAILRRIAHEMADYFAATNPNFNRTAWLTACDAACDPEEEE